jgi:hypothetical protein
MPRINVNTFTRDVQQGEAPERKKWGRWSVTIEGGFDETPRPILIEALQRVEGLIASTSDAASFPMYDASSESRLAETSGVKHALDD